MGALAGRLVFDEACGEVRDGPRRYLLMRADVLMGALARLPMQVRGDMLAALADSVRDNGADSVRAYLAQLGGDGDALLSAMTVAAADLGWGAWRFTGQESVAHREAAIPASLRQHAGQDDSAAPLLSLAVRNSPFVAGWRAEGHVQGRRVDPESASTLAVCAPIAGMLAAVADALSRETGAGGERVGAAASIEVVESHCAASHGGEECRFEVRAAPPALQPGFRPQRRTHRGAE